MSAEITENSKKSSRIFSAVIGLLIIAAGFGIAIILVTTQPKASPRQREKTTPIVEVVELTPTSAEVHIEAMGTVVAADEAEIQAEVTGQIVWVHPDLVDGGFVDTDTVLMKIDDRDYRYILRQRRASLEAAKAQLRIEEGQQVIADKEWGIVKGGDRNTDLGKELALRKPQLKAAKASVHSAQSEVNKANLDLKRTKIKAPFNAVIAEAKADVGDRASPGIVLARLISTDIFWVRASINSDKLKWLQFKGPDGQQGSRVVIHLPNGSKRMGELYKLAPELETSSRQAQILVSVEDPLLLKSKENKEAALLVGEFVRMDLIGITVENVIPIARTVLREGANLWLLDKSDQLRIIRANILWGTTEQVFVENTFVEGMRLITSSLGAPVEGMKLSAEGK